MSKVTLKNVGSGYNTQANINTNNDLIEAAFDNTISRNGVSPNEMLSDLDMNGHSIQNLPDAIDPREPITLSQAGALVGLVTPLTSDLVAQFLDPDDLVDKLAHCAEDSHGDTAYWKSTLAEDAVNAVIVNYRKEPGVVERYGNNTVPGTSDMGLAINTALLQNAQPTGAVVCTGPTVYYSSVPITMCPGGEDDKVWYSDNSVIRFSTDIHGVSVGKSTLDIEASRNKILGSLEVEHTIVGGVINSTKDAFRFMGCYEGEFHISAVGWATGYRQISGAVSCNHNKFKIGRMRNNIRGYAATKGAGSINHGDHRGGRWATSYPSCQWLIDLSESNSQKFHDGSLEIANPGEIIPELQGHIYLDGSDNRIMNMRVEGASGNAGIVQDWLVIADTALDCVVKDCYNLRSAYVTGRGNGGKYSFWDEVEFTTSGAGTVMAPTLTHVQGKQNDDAIPNGRFWEVAASASGEAGGLEVAARRAAGYLARFSRVGSIVDKGADTQNYVCIADHTSTADDEPGVGVNWEDYWEKLPVGNEDISASAWAVSTAYTGFVHRFAVKADGKILTNQTVASTATPAGPVSAVWPVYNDAGTLVGYAPLYASDTL